MRAGAHLGEYPVCVMARVPIGPTLSTVKCLLVIGTAAFTITASALAARAKAPAPCAAVRACLVQHGFTIGHEAHGSQFGWEFNPSAPWNVAGKGRGSDDAMVVVGA